MSSKVVACPDCTKKCLHLHRKTRPLSSVDSFFKVMFGDLFSEVLYFPPMFAASALRLANKTVILEDCVGHQWEVTVSNCEGCLAFQQGWRDFSLEHSLELGDFLLFYHITDLHFNVGIYTKTGCQKVEFPKRSNMRKRVNACPVLDTTNEELTNRQASCASVGSGSNVALSQDKCHISRNRIGNRDKRPKYSSSDIVDDSYGLIKQNKDIGVVENRSPLFDLFSMEMQIVNSGNNVNTITTKNVARAGAELNAVIDAIPVNKVQVDIKGEMDVLPLNVVSANEIIDKIQCSEEADKKMGVSDNDRCLDMTTEIPFVTSATNCDVNVEPICDNTPLRTVKDRQNVDIPGICNTPSTITGHDQESNKKRICPSNQCHGVKLECTPNSLEVNKTSITGHDQESNKKRIPPSNQCNGVKFECTPNSLEVNKTCLHVNVTKAIKTEPLEIVKEMDIHEDFTKEILEPEIKKEILEKSNQNGRHNNDSNVNVDSIATSGHISCIVAKDTASFQELPVGLNFSFARGQKNSEKKVVYLRDPRKRLWPILYHEKTNVQVLTSGWKEFCSANKIQSGDECSFYVEHELDRVFRVSVRKC